MSQLSEQSNNKVLVVQTVAWSLSLIVTVLALAVWRQTYGKQLFPVNNYLLFPLLGLVAFSLMWSHYVAGAIREMASLPKAALSRYFKLTSYAVLILICLHPGLLIYQLFRDGAGLPPVSYEHYVSRG